MGIENEKVRHEPALCCSAASPCNHQKRDPTTICDVCYRAAIFVADDLERHEGDLEDRARE